MDSIVDVYDQTTPSPAPPPATAPTYECKWAKISAVRLALVARNANYEKTAVTAAAPAWEGSTGNPIDLSAIATWQNYRYKVIQTVVPMRNLAWQGAQPGC
jgi:type IV pilus assembly protein PilW